MKNLRISDIIERPYSIEFDDNYVEWSELLNVDLDTLTKEEYSNLGDWLAHCDYPEEAIKCFAFKYGANKDLATSIADLLCAGTSVISASIEFTKEHLAIPDKDKYPYSITLIAWMYTTVWEEGEEVSFAHEIHLT